MGELEKNCRDAACCALLACCTLLSGSPVLGRGGLLLLFLLFFALPVQARPQVLVVLADHLTLGDVTRPDLPNFTRLRQEGELALMSPGLAQKPDPVANVYASLGAGDTVGGGDVSTGRLELTLRLGQASARPSSVMPMGMTQKSTVP